MARPSKYETLIGTKHGHLIVTGVRPRVRGELPRVICKCDCGQEAVRIPWNLTECSSCGHCGKRRMGDKISYSIPEPEYSRLKAEVILANSKVTERGCKEWQGYCHPDKGYGLIGVKDGKSEHTHRVVYRGVRGPIPEGWDVCHTCDNPPCGEPLHLFAAPRVANLIDMRNKGRNRQTQKTHCPQGHSYAEHGRPHYTKPTWRMCTMCAKDKSRRDALSGKSAERQRRRKARLRAELQQTLAV